MTQKKKLLIVACALVAVALTFAVLRAQEPPLTIGLGWDRVTWEAAFEYEMAAGVNSNEYAVYKTVTEEWNTGELILPVCVDYFVNVRACPVEIPTGTSRDEACGDWDGEVGPVRPFRGGAHCSGRPPATSGVHLIDR